MGKPICQYFISKLERNQVKSELFQQIKPALINFVTEDKQLNTAKCRISSNRKKRTTISKDILLVLLTAYEQNSYPLVDDMRKLSHKVGLDFETVKQWFYNFRRKNKNFSKKVSQQQEK